MAKYQIPRTNMSLPGQSTGVQANTGGEATGRAISNMGRSLQQIGTNIYAQRVHTMVADWQDHNAQIWNEATVKMMEDTNPDHYGQYLDEAVEAMDAYDGPLNGGAQRVIAEERAKNVTAWTAQTNANTVKRIKDQNEFIAARRIAEAIESGDPEIARAELSRPVEMNAMSQEQMDYTMTRVEKQAEITRRQDTIDAINMDIGTNPEQWKKDNATPEKFLANNPDAKARDWKPAMNLADSVIADNEREAANYMVALKSDALAKAEKGMSLFQFNEMLTQTQGLTPEDRYDLTRVFRSAQNVFATTGVDPWRQTQNPALVGEILHDIFIAPEGERKYVTPESIYDAWVQDGTPQFSLNDYQMLRNLHDDTYGPKVAEGWSKSFETVRMGIDAIEQAILGDKEELAAEDFAQYHRLLSMWITESQKPDVFGSPEKMATALDTILEPVKKDKAQGFLMWLWQGMTPKSPQTDQREGSWNPYAQSHPVLDLDKEWFNKPIQGYTNPQVGSWNPQAQSTGRKND
jgi:hypothetical protein